MRITRGGMQIPETQYTRSGEVSIAYQVFGSGDRTVVAVPPGFQSVELLWDWEPTHRYFERWGAFARCAQFDKRGMGSSDPTPEPPSIEERIDDIRAVMDAAGFETATLLGMSEGGPMAMLFAATYPERVDALILGGTFAASPTLNSPEARAANLALIDAYTQVWGTASSPTVDVFAPSQAANEGYRQWTMRYERLAAPPGVVRSHLAQVLDWDVTSVLGSISCPTLVTHARGDLMIPAAEGRRLAELIPGARLYEYDSPDHYPTFVMVEELLDEIETFLTGAHLTAPPDRVLATMLFTDVVDSTGRAVNDGDRDWHRTIDTFDHTQRGCIAEHGGRPVRFTGDGHVSVFDVPGRAIRCARALMHDAGNSGLSLRAGVHTAEVERRGDDIAGIGVHVAARLLKLCEPGEVIVSSAVPPLVLGSGLEFVDRGEHELKGVPGRWQVYAAN